MESMEEDEGIGWETEGDNGPGELAEDIDEEEKHTHENRGGRHGAVNKVNDSEFGKSQLEDFAASASFCKTGPPVPRLAPPDAFGRPSFGLSI
jgi:hypothetical protein